MNQFEVTETPSGLRMAGSTAPCTWDILERVARRVCELGRAGTFYYNVGRDSDSPLWQARCVFRGGRDIVVEPVDMAVDLETAVLHLIAALLEIEVTLGADHHVESN